MQLCREVARVVKCRRRKKTKCLQYNYEIKWDLVACQRLNSFLNDSLLKKVTLCRPFCLVLLDIELSYLLEF